jgi:hypothetical protein
VFGASWELRRPLPDQTQGCQYAIDRVDRIGWWRELGLDQRVHLGAVGSGPDLDQHMAFAVDDKSVTMIAKRCALQLAECADHLPRL